ncbi:MAG: hypothetical protein O3C67_13460 [Cyanobacteria bacterium]|nr:hypothetical protein [Cyanobacteriota bacterium]MEB3268806.1 hypothetical protein [Leptolyngbya sp.]
MSTTIVMLPHNTDVHPVPSGPTSPDHGPGRAPWHTLPFQLLNPYERVTYQYSPLGIGVKDAIALRPSNPHFIHGQRQIVWMPAMGKRGFSLELTQPLMQVQLWVRASQPVTLIALNHRGDCVALGHTPDRQIPLSGDRPLPTQVLAVYTHQVQTLHLSANTPFVVTQVRVQRSQTPVTPNSIIPLPNRCA